jgi:(R,R)-butanediol dehydrogenase/meso-butanediol dehydrogenase/diacetyl reductase
VSIAARYVGAATIDVADVDPPAPGRGEVQLAVAFTGICGTDLHILHGDMDARVTTPAVIGHEMSGRVLACGADVTQWSPGDQVTVMPLRWCGECAACRRGHRHVCERLDFMGIDSPGAMQNVWTVPESVLVRVPETISLRDAALIEPAAVAVHDVRRADLSEGESVVVLGGGPVGLLIAATARAQGAEVLLVEIDPYRRSIAEGLGLVTLDPRRQDVPAEVAEWSHGAGAAVTFEVTGVQAGLDLAVQLLAVRGRAVLVGIHSQPRPVDLQRVFLRELSLVGARVYERSDFDEAVRMLEAGLLPVGQLVSQVLPLTSAAQAFSALSGGGEVMKVLVDCGKH